MKRLLTGLILGFILAVGGVAVASIPDGSGTIHGCYKNSSGMLKVIDSGTQSCASGETPIAWSQTGPPGATGATGPQGNPGVTGSTGLQIYYGQSSISAGDAIRWVYLPTPLPDAAYTVVFEPQAEGAWGLGFCPGVGQQFASKFQLVSRLCTGDDLTGDHHTNVTNIPITGGSLPVRFAIIFGSQELRDSCGEADTGPCFPF